VAILHGISAQPAYQNSSADPALGTGLSSTNDRKNKKGVYSPRTVEAERTSSCLDAMIANPRG
jgi:hypothetical protein